MSPDKPGGDLTTRAFGWRWRRGADRAQSLRAFRRRVEARRAELDAIANRIDARIASGKVDDGRDDGALWLHRPECLIRPISSPVRADPPTNSAIGSDLHAHHDCREGVFLVAQRPNKAKSPRTRFELAMESFEFDGAYYSLTFALPERLLRPRPGDLLRLSVDFAATRWIKLFVRLNMRGADGSDGLTAIREVRRGEEVFDFDMKFADSRALGGELWVEMIFDRPRMIDLTVRDLSLSLLGERDG